MPDSEQILLGLARIANEWKTVAVLWHVYFALVAVLVLYHLNPSRRFSGVLLTLPLLSVSALAWMHANPFNGSIFALGGIALIAISMRLSSKEVSLATGWNRTIGAAVFLFGWAYPHFLEPASPWVYFYAAPVGLIPCPTLSISIGAAMLLNGLSSRLWMRIIAALGLFYGFYGALVLGVRIDFVLVVASFAAVIQSFRIAESH